MENIVASTLWYILMFSLVSKSNGCNTVNAVCSMRGQIRGTVTFGEKQGAGCFNSGNMQVTINLIGFPRPKKSNNNNNGGDDSSNSVYTLRVKTYGELMPACSGVGPDFGSGILAGDIGAFSPDQNGRIFNDTTHLPRSSVIKGRDSIIGRSVAIYDGPYSVYGNNAILDCCVIGYGIPPAGSTVSPEAPGFFSGNTFGNNGNSNNNNLIDNKFTLIGYGNNDNNPGFGFQSTNRPFGNSGSQSSLYGGGSLYGNPSRNNNGGVSGGNPSYNSIYNTGNSNYLSNGAPIYGGASNSGGGGSALPNSPGNNYNNNYGNNNNNYNNNNRNINPGGNQYQNPSIGSSQASPNSNRDYSSNNNGYNSNRNNNNGYNSNNNNRDFGRNTNNNNNNNNNNVYTNSQFPSVFQNIGSPDFFNLDASSSSSGSPGGYQSPFGNGGSLFTFSTPTGALGSSVNFQGTGIGSDRATSTPLPRRENSGQGRINNNNSNNNNNNINDQSLSDLFFANERGNPAAALLPSGGFKKDFDKSLLTDQSGSYANNIVGGSDSDGAYSTPDYNSFYDTDYRSSDSSKNHGSQYADSSSDYQDSRYDYSDSTPRNANSNTGKSNRYDYGDYDYNNQDGSNYYDYYDVDDPGANDRNSYTTTTKPENYRNDVKNNGGDGYKYTSYDKESNTGYSIDKNDVNDYDNSQGRFYDSDSSDRFVPSSGRQYDNTGSPSSSYSSPSSPSTSLSSPSSSSSSQDYTPNRSSLDPSSNTYSPNSDNYYYDDNYDGGGYSSERKSDNTVPDHLSSGVNSYDKSYDSRYDVTNDGSSSAGRQNVDYYDYNDRLPSSSSSNSPPPDGYIANYNYPGARDYEDDAPPAKNAYISSSGGGLRNGDRYGSQDYRNYEEPEIATSHIGNDNFDKQSAYESVDPYYGKTGEGYDYGGTSVSNSDYYDTPNGPYDNSNNYGGNSKDGYNNERDSASYYVSDYNGNSYDSETDNKYNDFTSSRRPDVNTPYSSGDLGSSSVSTPRSITGSTYDTYGDPNTHGSQADQYPSKSSEEYGTSSISSKDTGTVTSVGNTEKGTESLNGGSLLPSSPDFIGPAVSSTSLFIVPDDNEHILLPTSVEKDTKNQFVSTGPQPFNRPK